MDRRRAWGAWGAGLFVAALVAALGSFAESFLSRRPLPDLIDLIYGLNFHLLLALAGTLVVRLVFWKMSDGAFPWIVLAGIVFAEFSVMLPYWLARSPYLPPFSTIAGKIAVIVPALIGLYVAIYLASRSLIARRVRLTAGWARGGRATAGILLGLLLVLANGIWISTGTLMNRRGPVRPDAAQFERPDIFIILVDTLRRDHLSFYGYHRPTSPRIDRLFEQSIVFPAAYTPSTWTVPSIATLFSGLYPTSHGVYGLNLHLPEDAVTLAEQFSSYGYETAAFVDNPSIDGRHGFDQGFATFYPRWAPWWGREGRTLIEQALRRLTGGRTRADWKQSFGEEVNAHFLRWLDRGGARPRFAYLHYMEPHHPYVPSVEDRRAVAPGAPAGPAETPFFLDYAEGEACADWECLPDPPQLDPAAHEGMVANYDGEIRRVDRLIGEVLDALQARGLLSRAHVLFLTDHGEEFFEHRGWRHTYSIYSEVTGCAMAYRPPGGVHPSREIGRPVALLDLLRTVIERLGFEVPAQHQGHPIPELLGADPPAAPPPVLVELPPHLYALRRGPWRLIRRGPLNEPDWRLYNLDADPEELHNVAADLPDTVAWLRGDLEGRMAALSSVQLEATDEAPDPEALERLRALGYLR
jgi:arylsulfatase A-like enzyme